MRTIKFRGLDKGPCKKGWVYGYLTDSMKITPTGTEPRLMVAGYEVEEDSIGLFSGYHDKNGTEIYEGDVIKDGWDCVYVVVWDEKAAGLYLYMEGFYTTFIRQEMKESRIEIIGNIHDNKELIKHATPQNPQ